MINNIMKWTTLLRMVGFVEQLSRNNDECYVFYCHKAPPTYENDGFISIYKKYGVLIWVSWSC